MSIYDVFNWNYFILCYLLYSIGIYLIKFSEKLLILFKIIVWIYNLCRMLFPHDFNLTKWTWTIKVKIKLLKHNEVIRLSLVFVLKNILNLFIFKFANSN